MSTSSYQQFPIECEIDPLLASVFSSMDSGQNPSTPDDQLQMKQRNHGKCRCITFQYSNIKMSKHNKQFCIRRKMGDAGNSQSY